MPSNQSGHGRAKYLAAASAALAWLALAVPATAEDAAHDAPERVTATRVAGDESRTRFIADLTGPVELNVFALADPYRIVVDLPEIRFALPPDTGATGRGLVSAYRYGLISPGKSRIVLDVRSPVAVDKAFVVPAADGQPARLVVDLVATSRAAFLESARQYQAPSLDAPAPAPVIADGASDRRQTIVLDPGHGGIDSGAVGIAKTLEKAVVLEFSRILAAKLRDTGRYEVVLTREDDTFVRLGDRVEIARRHHADLFLSIHADSFRGHDVRGASVYTVSEDASNEMAAAIAAGENASDVLAGVDIADNEDAVVDILIDLARRETKNFSVVFARDLVRELQTSTRLFKNPHQEAGFRVLMAPDVPSVLVELGYLSNAEDEKVLTTDSWRQETADAMVKAIDAFFATRIAGASGR